MPIRPEQAREALPQVDPGRMRLDWPVGLRDGALLALLAAGLTAREISHLRASAVTMKRERLLVAVHRQGVAWYAVLPADLGSRYRLRDINEYLDSRTRKSTADPGPVGE